MLLAIDVGNTHIVLGTIDNGVPGDTIRFKTDKSITWAEYAIKFRQIFDISNVDYRSFDGAIISSVVPQVSVALEEAVLRVTGVKPLVVGPGIKTGVNIRIDDPSSAGADLITASAAAIANYSLPCILMDLGTATTVTVVDSSKSFIGGVIYPGVNISFNALTSGTSLLPAISITPPPKVISSNTVDCMRSGAVYGTASMLDGLIDRMEEELGQKCTVVATGGLAGCVVPCCRHKDIIVDDALLLKGLWAIWRKNI